MHMAAAVLVVLRTMQALPALFKFNCMANKLLLRLSTGDRLIVYA